nr:hypothetical protein [uncultured Sediminibacterium sp.]
MADQTLRNLLENNPEYLAVMQRYEQRHENALSFMTSAEFWQEELNKIKDYIKPLEIKVGGDFVMGRGFDFTKYQQYAYDWLRAGDNWPIKNIIGNAASEYKSIFGANNHDAALFDTSIFLSLQRGAAYLMYEKFLKDKLKSPTSVSLGDPGISYSVYDLLKLLQRNKPDNGLVYEIHDPQKMGPGESLDEFKQRSGAYYKAFLNPGFVDHNASHSISFAAIICNVWYFAEDVGSNTYLGTGPTSVLDMRKFCSETSLGILYVERDFTEWKNELLGNHQRKETLPDTRDVKGIYEEINRRIKLTGNEFIRHLNDFKTQNETGCRSYFLAGLSTHSDLIATGESENRIGRTDMLVIDNKSNHRFIYEFKIYKETSDINKGLEQIIFQYPTQEDHYNGLVILSRKKADFAKTLGLILERVRKSNIEIIRSSQLPDDPRTIEIEYKSPRNSAQLCVLTIFAFDLQE